MNWSRCRSLYLARKLPPEPVDLTGVPPEYYNLKEYSLPSRWLYNFSCPENKAMERFIGNYSQVAARSLLSPLLLVHSSGHPKQTKPAQEALHHSSFFDPARSHCAPVCSSLAAFLQPRPTMTCETKWTNGGIG
ncbi:hypothetical protein L3Q82_010892 [Scortum barcoo]|uniref:Uncharacterized protein n=1 Tax=Scortum barcoo TaxID=214431 RepID=A0ACB8W9C7_9TELE|nr:hypothetical protein L3Q82_010892 [Scortum barcoo]